ncbi:MAG: mechanosensitive ion channel [Candidatus Caldarchaeum sp.]|nr:mechanosensitive ion channel family protein [Candidatus Caldarchaeum sp.]MCX8201513.1 mechanosensitive ion channel family protein [Candidatus Caldarchaeum sp.]MDW8062900.1 mechanosensitive ion channel [Candidatus Caldarchaeum sp.]
MSSGVADFAKKSSKAVFRIVVYIVLYVLVAAFVQWFFVEFMPRYGLNIVDYLGYVQVLLALGFGYVIVGGVAVFFYWSMRVRYDHPTSAAVRNLVKIIGVGALIASVAGGVAGGAAGVALGGFIGLVIGFASQQVLGQAVAGLFILLTRPFKVGDKVVVAGEEGSVEDISALFTVVTKDDGTKVLVPNNSIIGTKITLKK